MDKPKCRLCGTNHWLSEPHEYSVQKQEKRASKAKGPRRQAPKPKPVDDPKKSKDEGSEASVDTLRKRRWRAANREKYNAYMKDFMRRKRNDQKDSG